MFLPSLIGMRSRSIPISPGAWQRLASKRPNRGFRSSFSRSWSLHLTDVSTKENIDMATLSYSVTQPALRSPVEEWQPHGKQSESTTEWWYLTAVVNDTAGNPYFLVWCQIGRASCRERV